MPETLPPLTAAQRDIHLEQVVQFIRERRATTRPALVGLTGLSRKIVIQRVDQLISMGLVREGPTAASTGGRPAVRLHFAKDAGCVLAVELGATGMTAGLTDMSGQLLASLSRRLPFGARPQIALKRAEELFTRLLDSDTERGPLRGIGVGVLGPVSSTGLTMDTVPHGGWAAFSVADWLEKQFKVPVWVDNEVNLMALGESRLRAGEQAQNILYIKVSTGIGAGLVNNGHLYRGASGVAGELGHMTVTTDPSLVCWCGNVGCLVTLASGTAIAEFGSRAVHRGESPYLSRITGRKVRDNDVVSGAHSGDPACLQIISQAGEALGLAVAGATNLFNPALIVIGGRVGGDAAELLTRPIRTAVEDHTFPIATQAITIESSEKAYVSGVSGGAAMVLEGLLSGYHLTTWQADLDRAAVAITEAG